jgi:hypothetical protein
MQHLLYKLGGEPLCRTLLCDCVGNGSHTVIIAQVSIAGFLLRPQAAMALNTCCHALPQA